MKLRTAYKLVLVSPEENLCVISKKMNTTESITNYLKNYVKKIGKDCNQSKDEIKETLRCLNSNFNPDVPGCYDTLQQHIDKNIKEGFYINFFAVLDDKFTVCVFVKT